jgi:hypothetical protein
MQQAGSEQRTTGKATGRNAAALKYDILSAMGVYACAGYKHRQRLVLRLITLIVARYNWTSDEIAVGQREMAALWSIDERSVKRDLAKLRDMGWLVQKRPAARGRVAVHGLDLIRILAETQGGWARVGSDFVSRMTEPSAAALPSNVIAFPVPQGEGGLWPRIQVQLHREDPALYGAWFAALQVEPSEEGTLTLLAPTRFYADYLTSNLMLRLERAAREAGGGGARIEIVWRP